MEKLEFIFFLFLGRTWDESEYAAGDGLRQLQIYQSGPGIWRSSELIFFLFLGRTRDE